VWETVSASWQHYLVLLWRAMIGMRMTVKTEHQLRDGGAPEYVGQPTRCSSSILVRPPENFCTQLWTAWRDRQCSTLHGQHFFMDILCCHTFCPQKPYNTTLFYRGTRIQGHRHLLTGAPSLQSCAYRSLHITIKLDSAAN